MTACSSSRSRSTPWRRWQSRTASTPASCIGRRRKRPLRHRGAGRGRERDPESVRDAVLARAARLCFSAQRLLEIVSVVPRQAELWLLADVEVSPGPDLDECLGSGLLTATRDALAFRHELVRLAIEDSLRPDRRAALHADVLAALERAPAGPVDAARLAHHAEGAGDAAAVLRYAAAAARRASALGSHSESAAQYARAFRFGDGLAEIARSDLLERLSYEYYLTGEFDRALETQKAALELRRLAGDPVAEADALRTLSRLLRYSGSVDEAFSTAQAAVEQLEETPPGRELAMAYCTLSHLYMPVEEVELTFAWAEKARALAEQLGDDEPLCTRSATWRSGDAPSRARGVRANQRDLRTSTTGPARQARRHDFRHVGLVGTQGPVVSGSGRAPRGGPRVLRVARPRSLALLPPRVPGSLVARPLSLHADVLEPARLVIDDQRSSPMPRIVALSVLGLVRARRGDPDVWSVLDEAWQLASLTGELQRIEPAVGRACRGRPGWKDGRDSSQRTSRPLSISLDRGVSTGLPANWSTAAGAPASST